jgi:hypothetical protein
MGAGVGLATALPLIDPRQSRDSERMDEQLLTTAARRSLSDVPPSPIRKRFVQSINLLENTTRGNIAEVIVADCCDGDLVGDGYGSWDVQWEAIRIEVKASGSVQSWPQKRRSPASFSIARAAGWIEQGDGSFLEDPEKLRRSDLYVFGHHEGGKPDVPEEWTF